MDIDGEKINNVNNSENIKKEEIKYIEIKPGQLEQSKNLAEKISIILDDKKAKSVKIIETNKQTIIADYFVIATGTSSTHIRSLAGEVEFQLKEKFNTAPSRISGHSSTDWIILDYDSVLAHIFNSEARDYYKLEKLWGDGESVNVDELLNLERNDKN
ncbi:MAG: ribosome silencing factor [Oscillospiraceae bacterium]|nr:ribosome silencing factor [Oscillospiraceae bacterium]